MGEITPFSPALVAGLQPPTPLNLGHDVSRFDCGKVALNDWLQRTARKAEGKSARCYVTSTSTHNEVVGYYCLAAGAVQHDGAPRLLRRNMPNPTPVVIIGRLAVDKRFQGKGVGRALLRDALLRIVRASDLVGARAVLVHAVDQAAVPFYARYDFRAFPNGSQTLYLPIESIVAAL